MKIAIVGANGFIGRNLARALSASGVEVVPITSQDRFASATGLLTEDLPVDPAIRGVVYLSQSPRYRDVPRSAPHLWGVNVVSAITAAEWARRCGATRFVYASTGNVYQPGFRPHREDGPTRRDSWYPLSKVQAEDALALFQGDLQVTSVRLFGVYGPGQHGKLIPNLIEAIRTNTPVRLDPHPSDLHDAGGLKLSLGYVNDVVQALRMLVMGDGPQTLNIAGPEALSIRNIADAIGAALGKAPVYHVTTSARAGDLIADNTELCNRFTLKFTTFKSGLTATIAAAEGNPTP